MFDSPWPHGLQHVRLPCPSLSPRVCSNSCPYSQWCYLTISSSATPFSSCLQSFPLSGSFPMSRHFASGGQSTGVSASASVLSMNIQGWFPLGLTGLTFLLGVKNHDGNGGNIHPQRNRVKVTLTPLCSWEQMAVVWTEQVICEGLEKRNSSSLEQTSFCHEPHKL